MLSKYRPRVKFNKGRREAGEKQEEEVEEVQVGMKVQLVPEDCPGTQKYAGIVIRRELDSVTVLWNDAADGGPPEKLCLPKEQRVGRDWWDSDRDGDGGGRARLLQRKVTRDSLACHKGRHSAHVTAIADDILDNTFKEANPTRRRPARDEDDAEDQRHQYITLEDFARIMRDFYKDEKNKESQIGTLRFQGQGQPDKPLTLPRDPHIQGLR